jgi:hypothetical protein
MLSAILIAAFLQAPATVPACQSAAGAAALRGGRTVGTSVAEAIQRANPGCDRFERFVEQLSGRGFGSAFEGSTEAARCRRAGFVEALREKLDELIDTCRDPSPGSCQASATATGKFNGLLFCNVAAPPPPPSDQLRLLPCAGNERFCAEAYVRATNECGPGTALFDTGEFAGNPGDFNAAVEELKVIGCDENNNNVID